MAFECNAYSPHNLLFCGGLRKSQASTKTLFLLTNYAKNQDLTNKIKQNKNYIHLKTVTPETEHSHTLHSVSAHKFPFILILTYIMQDHGLSSSVNAPEESMPAFCINTYLKESSIYL